MKLELGPIERHCEGYRGHSCNHADLLHEGQKVGSVHQHGWGPNWSFEINKFRWKYMDKPKVRASSPYELGGLYRLLFDGGGRFASAEEAKEACQNQLIRFLKKLGE